jgi:dipeptidyl-peptidase-4
MRIAFVPWCLFVAVLAAQEPGKERLTFADTQKPIPWLSPGPQVAIAWDGKHVKIDEKKALAWIDPATGKHVDPLPEPAGAPSTSVEGWRARIDDDGDLVLEKTVGAANDRGAGRRRGGRDGAVHAIEGSQRKLAIDGQRTPRRREAHVSGDGAFASFVQGNNLYVVDCKTNSVWPVTTDGGPELFQGLLDWVYQEEVYGRGNFQGHWWSPHGGRCAFLTLDEAPVKDYTIVEHVPPGYLDTERSVIAQVANYPKAGDPNPVARLSIAHAADRRVVPVDLSAFPKDVLIVRVMWTEDGRLLVTLQDRPQTWAEFGEIDPATGRFARWIREESKTWTNRPDAPRFLGDGTFLWLSERTGYQHVYRYKVGGELLGAVTSGEWQVRSVERVDATAGAIWFEGTKDGAAGRHLYRAGLDGKNLVLLTPGAGTHVAELAPDGSFLIDRWSTAERPTAVRICDAAGHVTAELGQAGTGSESKYAFAPKRCVQIRARDGCLLDATVQLPTEWQMGKLWPVYLETYSGPDAPTVHDEWSHTTMQQFHAQQGFINLQVNVRTAGSRGQAFTGLCYQRLGEQELKDLEDAVDWVCEHHGGDPARVAISGWSYGGFITAFALTHSTKFALGIAGAGVYDWRLYDSIYTERYMNLPDANREGYDATSVIKAANRLHGHLVLIHGTMDDNVHVQNTIQLLWELEKANKQNFELMLYPRSQHGISRELGGHLTAYEWRQLQKLLDPGFKAE